MDNNENIPVVEATNVSKQQTTQQTTQEPDIQLIIQETEQNLLNSMTNELMMKIYSRAKIVKYLSIIDMFFLVINFGISLANHSFFWLFIFLFPLCILGYNGATKFKKNYILAYSFYLLITCIYSLSLFLIYGYILSLIILFIEVYFLQYTLKLYKYLNNSSEEIINSLREGWNPNNIVYYYI